MANMLSENYNIVHVLEAQDHNAGVDGDSFHAGRISHFALLLSFGELAGDAVLKVFSGATAGTKTTAETFRYRVSDSELKTSTGDTYAAWATSAGLTLTAASYEDFSLIVEMDSDELTDGQPWVTVEVGSEASEIFVAIMAVCTPRFAAHDPLTLIE